MENIKTKNKKMTTSTGSLLHISFRYFKLYHKKGAIVYMLKFLLCLEIYYCSLVLDISFQNLSSLKNCTNALCLTMLRSVTHVHR